MKKRCIVGFLLLFALVFVGCSNANVKNTVSDTMRSITAADFKYMDAFLNVDKAELAAALNAAANKSISETDAAACDFDENDPLSSHEWNFSAWLELDEEGLPSMETKHFDFSCGQTENIVQVALKSADEQDRLLIQDETLYRLIRCSKDPVGGVDQAAYAQFADLLRPRMEERLAILRDNPMQPTGYEVTLFVKYLTYEDPQFNAHIDVYDFDFAMPLAHPEIEARAGGQRLDSQLRLADPYVNGGNITVCYQNGRQISVKVWDSDTCYGFSPAPDPDEVAAAQNWAAEQLAEALRKA